MKRRALLPGGAALLAAAVAAAALLPAARAAGEAPDVPTFDLAAHGGQSVSGLRLTLKRHPGNGRVKELLAADKAEVDERGIVRASGRIQLVEFDENGATNGFAVGLGGFFDPVRSYAECHGPVAFVRPGIVLTGTNLTWDSKINVLRIETNAVLNIRRDGRSVVDAFAR